MTTITVACVIVAGMDDLEQKHLELVERIGRYPVTDPTASARTLAGVQVRYRRERAAEQGGGLRGRVATQH